jgi:hypothetical protein
VLQGVDYCWVVWLVAAEFKRLVDRAILGIDASIPREVMGI